MTEEVNGIKQLLADGLGTLAQAQERLGRLMSEPSESTEPPPVEADSLDDIAGTTLNDGEIVIVKKGGGARKRYGVIVVNGCVLNDAPDCVLIERQANCFMCDGRQRLVLLSVAEGYTSATATESHDGFSDM